jgi:hypothetical protein
MQLPPKITWALMALAAVVVVASPAAAQTVTVNRCAAAKVRCVMGYGHICGVQGVRGLFRCYEHATTRGRFVDQVCVQRTEDKLAECWRDADAERRYGPCLTLGDLLAVQTKIEDFVLGVVEDVTPGFPYPIANDCAAGKQRAVAEATFDKLECFREAFHDEPGIVDAACLSRTEAHYASAWAKLESSSGCLTMGDAAAIEAKIDSFVADIVTSLDP